ncbi:MAG: hypothetical protein Q4A92_01185 [Corynebacterium sp.]|nr:hypothetical protein [Corynebacterium sp.]
MIPQHIGNAAGFFALSLLYGVACGFALSNLPPIGASPEFFVFMMFVALNFIGGVAIGGTAVRRFGVRIASLVGALLCAIASAFGMSLGIGFPGVAGLGIGPVMAGMAYWSAAVSYAMPKQEEHSVSTPSS